MSLLITRCLCFQVLALLFIYNTPAAALLSIATGAFLSLMKAFLSEEDKLAWWIRLACIAVWLTVLLFWQRIRCIFRNPRHAFLDKLCIHQTDIIKKEKGIKGLAGFLRVSDRLVILWSPSYFTRLWCAYELVAWYHMHGATGRAVHFLPVSAAEFCLSITIGLILGSVVASLLTMGKEADDSEYIIVKLAFLLAVIPVFERMVESVQTLKNLEESLKTFRIDKTHCFCCSNDHKFPGTDTPIPCDRKMVHYTLLEWSQSRFTCAQKNMDLALDQFNQLVQNELSSIFMGKINKTLHFCGYWDIVRATVPFAWSCCSYIEHLVRAGEYGRAVRWVIEFSTPCLFTIPITVAIAIIMTEKMDKWKRCCGNSWCFAGFSRIVTFFTCVICFVFMWLPGPILVDLPYEADDGDLVVHVPWIVRYMCLALLTAYMMGARCPCRRKEQDLALSGRESE
eukprot:TRINITY_DN26251_c0_g1_i5.p1 TRINITY_DN26251_c0_g1~~TRINITY_DN26251_c0_g1_i5.p1  ORF type:complete len:453 (+),score=38.87 TRINITY_DN26251_c0_g1_i5:449-1807(+)